MAVSEISRTDSADSHSYRPAAVDHKIHEQKWLARLNEHIDANLHHSDFNLMDLAFELNLSVSSLYRKVVKLSGLSPNDYIRNKRLEKAKCIMESNDSYNLDQVTEKIGYQRKDYFVRLYVEKYGRLPVGFQTAS
jgi:AraC-like DNA-binding protein